MGSIADLRQWALGAEPENFWFVLAALAALTLAAFAFAFVFLRRARIIEDTPTSKIRSAAQGYVELSGRGMLMDGAPIIAPLTTIQCTWYRYTVEKLGDKHSRIVESGTSDELFLLEGATGCCVIDPEGAVVTASTKQVWYESSYPSRRNIIRGGSLFGGVGFGGIGKRYRYTEERMHSGEPLYAIGMFMSVGGASEAFNRREEVAALLKEWKQDHTSLLKNFDTNGDAEIDLQEWEAVRKAAHQQVRKAQTEQGLKPATHIMVKPKYGNRPYLLSVRPQRELVKNYKLKAAACLAGFLLTGSTGVWMATLRLM